MTWSDIFLKFEHKMEGYKKRSKGGICYACKNKQVKFFKPRLG